MTYIKPQLPGAGTTSTAAGGSQARQQPGRSVPAAMNGRDARAHDAAAALIQFGRRLSAGPFASHGLETSADPLGRITRARDLAYTVAVATGHSPAEAMRVAVATVDDAHAVCFVTDGAPAEVAPAVANAADAFAHPPRASALQPGLESDPDIFDTVVETSCREGVAFPEIIVRDYGRLSITEQRVLHRETAAVVFRYVTACAAYEAVQSLRAQLASARVEEVGELRAQLRASVEHYEALRQLAEGVQTQMQSLSDAQTVAQTAVTTLTGGRAFLAPQLLEAIDALSGFVDQVGTLPTAFAELFGRVRDSAAEISARAATLEDHEPHRAVTESAQGQTAGMTSDLETIYKPATQASIDRRLGAGYYVTAVRTLDEWVSAAVPQDIIEAALTYALQRIPANASLLDLMSAATATIKTYRGKLAEIHAATTDVALRARVVQLVRDYFREERDPRGLHVGRLLQAANRTVEEVDDPPPDVAGATSIGSDASGDGGAADHRGGRPEPKNADAEPAADAASTSASVQTLTRAVPLSQVTRAAVDAKVGSGAEQRLLTEFEAYAIVSKYGIPPVLLTVLIRYFACQPKMTALAALRREVRSWLDGFEPRHLRRIDAALGTDIAADECDIVLGYLFAQMTTYLFDGGRLSPMMLQYPIWIPEARAAVAANPAAGTVMLDALQTRIDQLDSGAASASVVVDAATAAIVPAVSVHVVAIPAKARSEHPIYQLAELIFGFAHNGPFGSTGRVHQAIFYLLFRGPVAGKMDTKYWDFLYRSFLRIRRRVDAHYGIAKNLSLDDAVEQLRTLTVDQATDRQWRIASMIGSIKTAMMEHKKKEFPEKDAVNLVIMQTLSARHLTGDEAAALLGEGDPEPGATDGESAWDTVLGPGADAVITGLMSHVPPAIKRAVRVDEWQRLFALPDYEAVPSGYRWRALHQVIHGLQSGRIHNGDSERLLHSYLNAWGESDAALLGELLGVPLASLKTPPYLPAPTRDEILARAMAEAKTFDWDVTTSPLGTPVSGAAVRLKALIDTLAEGWRPQHWNEAVAVLRSGEIEDVDDSLPVFKTLTTVPTGLTRATYAPILIAAVAKAMTEEWNAERLQAHVNEQVAADAQRRAQDAYRAHIRDITGRMTRLRDDHADPDLVAEGDGKLSAVQAAVERGEFDPAALTSLEDYVKILEELR